MRDGGPGGSPGAAPSDLSAGGKLPDKAGNGGQGGGNRKLLLGVVAALAVILFVRSWMGSEPVQVVSAPVEPAPVLSSTGAEAVALPKAAAPKVAAAKPAPPSPVPPRPTPVVPAPREEEILDGRPMDAPFLGVIFIQWARGPEERLASLRLTGGGMAMVRENDIVNGLRVVRIEREGLVLAWKGQQYREVVERF